MKNPKIVMFCCNWNAYARAELADPSGLNNRPFRVIKAMCSGRVEPTLVLRAFDSGADGVMVVGCNLGDCHYNSGNYKARRRLMLLRNMLTQLGIEPERLRFRWVSDAEVPELKSEMDSFADEVAKLGSPTSAQKVMSKVG